MSRVLRRPMFRRGGQAEGITTGLGRQGYARAGSVQSYKDFRNMLDTIAPRGTGNFNDFLMNLSLNLVGNPPSGNILQTVATEAQGPFQQFQRAKAQERAGDRDLAAEWLKSVSDQDLSAIEEKIKLRMTTHDEDYDTAAKAVWETFEFSKSGHVRPEEAQENRLEYLEQELGKELIKPPLDQRRPIAWHIYKIENNLYPENVRNDMAKGKTWLKDSHISRAGSTVKDGKIDRYELSEDGKNVWNGFEGKIVYDYRTNSLFRKQGNFFILVEDINKE
tara:strand:+ start:730 stop:1560 length:831 start_codon:yes stop_codon:yes gene_type:complete